MTLPAVHEGTRELKAIKLRHAAIRSPGWTEQALVVVTTFVFINQLPNTWFASRSELLATPSNPILTVAQLGLVAIAFVRVMGLLNHLLMIIQAEVYLFAFVAVALFSTIWSADQVQTAKEAIILLAITLYAAYLVLRFPLSKIIELLSIMFVLSGAINLVWVFAFPQFGVQSNDLWSGVFAQKNGLGFMSAIAIPTLWVAARSSRKLQIVYLLSMPVHLVLLLGSGSKTMLVAAGISTGSIFLLGMLRSRRTMRGGVLMAIGILAGLTTSLSVLYLKQLTDLLDKDVTLTGRIPLWETILPLLGERPWFGWGFEAAFGGYFSPTHEVWIAQPWKPSHAHNLVIHLWLELGMIGLVFFLAFLVRSMMRGVTIIGQIPGPLPLWPLVMLVFSLSISITETGMYRSSLGWLLMAVSVMSVAVNFSALQLASPVDAAHAGDHQPGLSPPTSGPRSPSIIEGLPMLEPGASASLAFQRQR